MLGKLRKLNHPFCMEGLKKDFFKQLDTEDREIPEKKNISGIERLRHFGVATNLSVPRVYGAHFAISLQEVGDEGMDGKR